MARLTKEQWEELHAHYATGRYNNRELGQMYGVSHVAIQKKAKSEDWVKDGRSDVVIRHNPFSPGFIYVLSFNDSSGERFCKIGMAKNLETRVLGIQTSLPFKIKVEMCFYSESMAKTEKEIHANFKDHRVFGEWFSLTDEHLKLISSYCYRES